MVVLATERYSKRARFPLGESMLADIRDKLIEQQSVRNRALQFESSFAGNVRPDSLVRTVQLDQIRNQFPGVIDQVYGGECSRPVEQFMNGRDGIYAVARLFKRAK